MATYRELLQQREELSAQIEQARNTELAAVKAQIHQLMDDYGITPDDLQRKIGRQHALAGSKLAPKYRDPNTGKTWSGRGLKPKWVKERETNGENLKDFAIESPSA